MVSQSILRWLVVAALLLPITICVFLAVGRLLVAMKDPAGWQVLHYLALGCGVVWLVDLIVLSIAVGINSLNEPSPPRDEE